MFGQTVTYTPAGDSARDITGAFDAATELIETLNGIEITSLVPTLGLHLADLDPELL